MSLAPDRRFGWVAPPRWAAVGFGWELTVGPDHVCWKHRRTGRCEVVLRTAGCEWDLRSPPRPSPNGGFVDLGERIVSRTALVPAMGARTHFLGHSVVARSAFSVHTLDGTTVRLPDSARQNGARPWPHPGGWAWADGDTLYRMDPSGQVSVAARVPGTIHAWDVGPRGAVWLVGAGCLWLAGPTEWARRVTPTIEAALGIAVEDLEPGALVFADDGLSLAALEVEGAHRIELSGRPKVGAKVGSVVGLSPHPCPFPVVGERALACVRSGWVARVTRSSIWRMDPKGVVSLQAIELAAPPSAVGLGDDGSVTVLVGSTLTAVHPRGPVLPHASTLEPDLKEPVVVETAGGAIWVAREGAVVPITGTPRTEPGAVLRGAWDAGPAEWQGATRP